METEEGLEDMEQAEELLVVIITSKVSVEGVFRDIKVQLEG